MDDVKITTSIDSILYFPYHIAKAKDFFSENCDINIIHVPNVNGDKGAFKLLCDGEVDFCICDPTMINIVESGPACVIIGSVINSIVAFGISTSKTQAKKIKINQLAGLDVLTYSKNMTLHSVPYIKYFNKNGKKLHTIDEIEKSKNIKLAGEPLNYLDLLDKGLIENKYPSIDVILSADIESIFDKYEDRILFIDNKNINNHLYSALITT